MPATAAATSSTGPIDNLKAAREELGGLAKRMTDMAGLLTGEKREFTKEEEATWQKLDKDYEVLKRRVEIQCRADEASKISVLPDRTIATGTDVDSRKEVRRLEKQNQRAAERDLFFKSGKKITEEDRALIMQGWMRVQEGKTLKRQHEWALEKCKVNPRSLNKKYFDIQLGTNYNETRARCAPHVTPANRASFQSVYENRSLALNVNTAGGYLIPEGFVQNVEVALLLYSNLREQCDLMRTTSGQDLPWPTVNDTFNKGAILTENAIVTEKDIVFGNMVLHAYKYTSFLVTVPVELLEDAAIDLASLLGTLLGIRIGRIQNDHMTFGTGVAQPTGLMTAATQGIQAASPTAIAFDDLFKLEHAVDPAYRNRGQGCGFMFHDQILSYLKRVKDGAGRPLWQAGVAGIVPDTIDGYPWMLNQSMSPTMASTNRTVVFGALKKYKCREVSSVRLRRLVERYADLDQEGYVMFARFDSNLLDAGQHPVQYLVH